MTSPATKSAMPSRRPPPEQRAIHGLALALQKTGQLTLSNYVIHLTLGMLLLAGLTGKPYTGGSSLLKSRRLPGTF